MYGLDDTARWFCEVCQTFGGGAPNYMTTAEHIDAVHDGGIVRMRMIEKPDKPHRGDNE